LVVYIDSSSLYFPINSHPSIPLFHTKSLTSYTYITMKEVIAENYALESLQEEEEEEADRLSFCNLPMEENNSGSTHQSPRSSSAQTDHLFEFFISQPRPAAHSNHNDIIFCGKIIHEEEEEEEDQLNEYQKRDYFATIKSQSFRKLSFPDHDAADNRRFSASTRLSGDLTRPKCSTGDLDYHVQRVNITSLTSMSAKSRRRMFMFGPVKFRPEMELSAIKQRQARRAPAEKAAASGGGKSQWGVVRSSLRGRSHLTSVLARSLGCIPVAGGGVERWVGVAN
ncbi:hypothetical protein Pfo_015647, partial [Paulownia fortunei]